ncbi:MAG: hypothetical protein U0R50_13165 [Gaiellales bacterium]
MTNYHYVLAAHAERLAELRNELRVDRLAAARRAAAREAAIPVRRRRRRLLGGRLTSRHAC